MAYSTRRKYVLLIAIAIITMAVTYLSSTSSAPFPTEKGVVSAPPAKKIHIASLSTQSRQPTAATGPSERNTISAHADMEEAQPGLESLHVQIRTEPRDEKWASVAEIELAREIMRISFIDSSVPLLTRCGSTMCEVVGRMMPGVSAENMNVAMHQLQAPISETASHGAGLNPAPLATAFRASGNDVTGPIFVKYLRRNI